MSRIQSINFKKLVEAHHTSLYRFAYCLTNEEPAACDLTQHTFFLYANRSDELKHHPNIKSWLYTTVYHEFQRRRQLPSAIEVRPPLAPGEDVPAASVETVATLDGVNAANALAQIEEALRTPLAAFYLHDLSYPEIAEIMQVPVSEILTRVVCAKDLLKKILYLRTHPA